MREVISGMPFLVSLHKQNGKERSRIKVQQKQPALFTFCKIKPLFFTFNKKIPTFVDRI